MKIPNTLAQLRHAYAQLSAGLVIDQKSFADGLLAPAIRTLETSLSDAALVDEITAYFHENPSYTPDNECLEQHLLRRSLSVLQDSHPR